MPTIELNIHGNYKDAIDSTKRLSAEMDNLDKETVEYGNNTKKSMQKAVNSTNEQTVALKKQESLIEGVEKDIKAWEQAMRKATDKRKLKEYNRGLNSARRRLEALKKKGVPAMKSVNKEATRGIATFKKLGGVIAGAFSVGLLVRFSKESIRLYDRQIKAEKSLELALGRRSKALLNQASALQKVTRVGDEEIIVQQAFLAALGFTEKQIKEMIPAALDLAAATGQTLEFAVRNLSKTYAGLTGELGELIPQLKDFSVEELKAGKAVEFATKQFKGQAEEAALAGSGVFTQLGNAWGDMMENFGEGLTSVLNPLAKRLKDVISDFKSVGTVLQEEQLEVNSLVESIILLNEEDETRVKLIDELTKKYPGFIELLGDEGTKNENLVITLEKVNEQYAIKNQQLIIEEAIGKKQQEQNDLLKSEFDLRKQIGESIATKKDAEETLSRLNDGEFKKMEERDRIALRGQLESIIRRRTASIEASTAEADAAKKKAKEIGLAIKAERAELIEFLKDRLDISDFDLTGGGSKVSDVVGGDIIKNMRIAFKLIEDDTIDWGHRKEQLEREQNEILGRHQMEGVKMTERNTKELLREYKEFYDKLKKEQQELELFAEEHPFWEALGLTNEDQLNVINQISGEVVNAIGSITDSWVQSSELVVDTLNTRIAETQRSIDQELQLQERGYANNVNAKRNELELLKKERDRALVEQEKAVKAQQALDTITQSVNLAVSVTNILKEYTKLGPWGLALAGAGIAGLFAIFKSALGNIDELTKFEEGGLLRGKSHAQGGIKVRGLGAELEGGEFVMRKSVTEQNLPFLEAMNEGKLKVDHNILNGMGVLVSEVSLRENREIVEIRDMINDMMKEEKIEYIGGKKVVRYGNVRRRIG